MCELSERKLGALISTFPPSHPPRAPPVVAMIFPARVLESVAGLKCDLSPRTAANRGVPAREQLGIVPQSQIVRRNQFNHSINISHRIGLDNSVLI